MADWYIATTLKEPIETVERFVAWHLGIGATGLFLFFDDPYDPAYGHVAGLKGVTAFRCNVAHWEQVIGGPPRHPGHKQIANATFAYQQIQSGWLGSFDTDEIVWMEDDVGKALDEIEADTVLLPNLEYVSLNEPGQTSHFRLPYNARGQCDVIHGELASVLRRNGGFVGYTGGKVFARAQIPNALIKQHRVSVDGRELEPGNFAEASAARLLHFYAPSWDEWRSRLAFRLSAHSMRHKYRSLVLSLLENNDEDGLRNLYDALHSFAPAQASQMREYGLLQAFDLNFGAVRNRYFPEGGN